MRAQALVLARGLRDKQMRFEEYERSVIDKTLTSALAGVYLGSKKNNPQSKMEKSWSAIVGDMLPPLLAFVDETKAYMDNGVLIQGDKTLSFADPEDVLSGFGYEITDPEATADEEIQSAHGQGRTWPGLFSRLVRYISTPVYSFASLGAFLVAQDLGMKEMRRVARLDKKTCKECKEYDSEGWVPFGELPMPGKGCRCFDHCRCQVEYR